MRYLEIEERIELADIEDALNKEFQIAKNVQNDFYITRNFNDHFIIDKKGDKYVVDFCSSGFLVEDPNIKNLFEGKEFSKDELVDFLRNFEDSFSKLFGRVHMDLNKIDELEKYNLLGINLNPRASFDEIDCDYNTEKNFELDIIVYIENSDKKIYRLAFDTTHGMCGSGWTTATWGDVVLSKCEKLPSEFLYKPIKPIKVVPKFKPENNANSWTDAFFDIRFYVEEEEIGWISCDYDGGDSYYPMGCSSDNMGLTDNAEKLKEYFEVDDEKFAEITAFQERIPIIE